MAHWLNLPALGGSLLGAIVLGIHLGEGTIGLINPVHFQGPAIHPRDRGAAIAPTSSAPERPPAYHELYGWEEGRAALLADCGDCAALAARDGYAYSAAVPYFGGEADSPPTEPVDELLPEVQSFDEASDEWAVREAHISRYADYPVTEAEEPARFEPTGAAVLSVGKEAGPASDRLGYAQAGHEAGEGLYEE